MTKDEFHELVQSHDELTHVCQAAFEVILRAGLQKNLDKKLNEHLVESGFAERAEQIRQKISREYMQSIAGVSIEFD
jgi:hypothetical protein